MVNEKWITDEIMALKQGGGSSKAHATTHGNAGTDRVTLDASQITTGVLDAARIPSTSLDWNIPFNANLTKKRKDANGVYLQYEWELTTAITGKPAKWVSEISTNYTSRTMTVYDSDKTTKLGEYTFTRTLDSDGNLVSEVLQ